jgi:hypothetical protein
MRTTVQIDDELLRRLKEQAHREGTSLAKLINRVLRCGIAALRQGKKPSRPYREKTFSMGEPKVPLDKALALAAALEDEEVREELARRK